MANSEVPKALAELYTWLEQGAKDRPEPDAVAILLLEHHKLLVKAARWDEARRIVREAAKRDAIFFGALDDWGRELIALLTTDAK